MLSDFSLFNLSPIRKLIVLMSVQSLLGGAREAGLLLTIDLEIPSVFLLA